jgi:hypothetical protein
LSDADTKPSGGTRAPLFGPQLTAALTVAMAIAPGVYARNQHFALHQRDEVKRAKKRAAFLRGALRHLPRAREVGLRLDGGVVRLHYRVPELRFERSAELTELEGACLRYLARRAGVEAFGADENDADRAAVEGALAHLGQGLLPPTT